MDYTRVTVKGTVGDTHAPPGLPRHLERGWGLTSKGALGLPPPSPLSRMCSYSPRLALKTLPAPPHHLPPPEASPGPSAVRHEARWKELCSSESPEVPVVWLLIWACGFARSQVTGNTPSFSCWCAPESKTTT